MKCKSYLKLMLLLICGMLTTTARGALYLIPEYNYDTTRTDPHWCDFAPEDDGSYKEAAASTALWCDGFFDLGNLTDGTPNPRNAEKAYRYQFRHSYSVGDVVRDGGFWEGPVVGYCFLPADKYVWYIHLNLNLGENEAFRFRISAARSLSDTYYAAGYDLVDGNYGQNPDTDRNIVPFTTYDIRKGISLGDMGLEDAAGFTSKENIDKVPFFSVTGLRGLYTLRIEIDQANPGDANLILAPSLFATGSLGFAEATGSSFGNYEGNTTENPTAEFVYDTDGKYKMLIFPQNFSDDTAKDWIRFHISKGIGTDADAGFWNRSIKFDTEVGAGNTKENVTIGTTYQTSTTNTESGLLLQKDNGGSFTEAYRTVELELDEKTKEVKTLTVAEGNTIQCLRRGYKPPRIYLNDNLVKLDFDRAYNCWYTEFVAPAGGETVTYRRRPFWIGDVNSSEEVLKDTEKNSELIPGRTYQLIVDNSSEDRTIICREMPVYITGYSKTFGDNPDDATGWNSNTSGQFTQVANGIYYFPVRFKGSCEFGISKTRGTYWENFDDGRAYNESGSTLKEDGKSRLMEVPFGEFKPYEGFGAPKGQNFNWKFNDELNSDVESWYIIVVDVNDKKVSVQRPGLSPVISDFRISPLEEDPAWMDKADMFTADNQPFGSVLNGAITDPVRYTRLNHISCRLSFTSEYQLPGVFESVFNSLSLNGTQISGVTVDGGTIDFIDYAPDDNYEFMVITDLRFPKKDDDGNVVEGEFTTQQNNIELTKHLSQKFEAPSVTVGDTYVIKRESGYDGQTAVALSISPSYNDIREQLHVYSGFRLGKRSHNTAGTGSTTREYRGYILSSGAGQATAMQPLDGYTVFDGGNYGAGHDWSSIALTAGKMPLHIGNVVGDNIDPYSIFTATVDAGFYAHYPVLTSDNGAEFTSAVTSQAVSRRVVSDNRHIERVDAPAESPVRLPFAIRGPLSGLEETNVSETSESEYFDLGGRPVDGGSLRPGVYIRKTGDAVEKLIIR